MTANTSSANLELRRPIQPGEHRNAAEIRVDYEIEKELAARLRNAPKDERRHLYTELYNEFYRRVPRTPQLYYKASTSENARIVEGKLAYLSRFVNSATHFLEIGPGDCALCLALTQQVAEVYAVDVSDEITRTAQVPPNFHLALSDGDSVPVPPASIDVAYSHHVMEHLHPEDAKDQLANLYRALKSGAIYACITPNRLSGPHDISLYFDDVATGFHLREYTTGELITLLRKVGFRKFRVHVGGNRKNVLLPTWPVTLCEIFLDALPKRWSGRLARSRLGKLVLGVELIARK